MTKWIVVAGRQIFRLALFFSFPQSFPLTVQSPQTIHHARFGAHTKKHCRTTNIATRTVKRKEKINIYIIVLRHLAVFKCRFVSRITRDLNRCHAGLENKKRKKSCLTTFAMDGMVVARRGTYSVGVGAGVCVYASSRFAIECQIIAAA